MHLQVSLYTFSSVQVHHMVTGKKKKERFKRLRGPLAQDSANVNLISLRRLLRRVASLHFPSMDIDFSPYKKEQIQTSIRDGYSNGDLFSVIFWGEKKH